MGGSCSHRARLKILPTKQWLISHVFQLSILDTDRVICITEAAISVLPNVDDKIDIKRNAVTLMHALGNDLLNVAIISSVEKPDKKISSSIEASEVAQRAKDCDAGE